MQQRRDNQSSPTNKDATAGGENDVLTVTHTPTTISIGSRVADVDDVKLPRSIGNVTIQNEIGRGGMGIVFQGWDTVLHRAVAVKFLLSVATQEKDPQFDRFFGGARAEAAIKHPYIVTVFDAGQVTGVPYLVMEFIDGPSLSALIRQNRVFLPSVAVKVLWDVAEAVRALHERDIIHRDLKPSNVLFDRTGHLLVTDFGLASLCRRVDDPAEAVGTPAYMAPETFAGRASPQSDVYAMGCMLFELLTGRLPFTGDVQSVRDQHSSAPLPVDQLPDSIPSSLVDVIERATHKKEVFRYRRAGQFQRALQDSMATNELLREGAAKLATLVLTQHEEVSSESGMKVSETPSTGIYFERLSVLASKKRDKPTRLEKSEPSSEQVDQKVAGQVAEPKVPIRRDPLQIDLTCATSARTSNLTEIPLDGCLSLSRKSLRGLLPLLAFAVVAAVVLFFTGSILAEMARADGRSALWVLVFWVVVLGFVGAFYWVAQRLMQSRVRSMTVEVEQRGVSAVANDVMSYAFRWHSPKAPVVLMKALVEERRLGFTLRVCPKDQAVSIDPIDVPFEPVMLDEADTAFMGLLGTVAIGRGDSGEAGLDSDAPNESQALRRVRRNFRMKGGWLMVVVFASGVNLVLAVIKAIRRGEFDWMILMFVVVIASIFLEPAGGSRAMRKQWLLVPRGLVLRKADGRRGGWKVHLFERDRSVLCVCRHDKRKWRFFVGDAEKCETSLTTNQEIDVLLAAWLSPLDAPSPDRLTDLS